MKCLVELIDEVKEKLDDDGTIGDAARRAWHSKSIVGTPLDVIEPGRVIVGRNEEIDPVIEIVRKEALLDARLKLV